MSEPQCTLVVLALAVFWAAASAAVMLDSIAHNRKALAWQWAASFAGASLGAAYCCDRLAWVVA